MPVILIRLSQEVLHPLSSAVKSMVTIVVDMGSGKILWATAVNSRHLLEDFSASHENFEPADSSHGEHTLPFRVYDGFEIFQRTDDWMSGNLPGGLLDSFVGSSAALIHPRHTGAHR